MSKPNETPTETLEKKEHVAVVVLVIAPTICKKDVRRHLNLPMCLLGNTRANEKFKLKTIGLICVESDR